MTQLKVKNYSIGSRLSRIFNTLNRRKYCLFICFYDGECLFMANTECIPKRWRIRKDDLQLHQHQNCLHQLLPEDLGEGYSNICRLDDDLTYIESEYTPSKNLAILSQTDNQEPRLVLTLGLKGSSRFESKNGDDVIFNEGYTSITTFNSSIGERQYQKNEHILQLRFSINKNWLQRYFGRSLENLFINKKSIQTISYKPMSTQGMLISQQLRSNKVTDEAKKLFIHGQSLSLLVTELAPLFSNSSQPINRFSKSDKEIANRARDILYKEFKTPPSVEKLSKQVGCNQFKLKKIFHHFFNNTPYGVLLEIRMNNAYQLLESTHCHVNIAAEHVGYNHASNFSTAFIKYFGVPPKSIAK